MSFIVYLLIFESFRTTQSRITRIDLYKDQLRVQATCGLHFVVLRNIHSLLGGHFCFRLPPPSPPIPTLQNPRHFPTWLVSPCGKNISVKTCCCAILLGERICPLRTPAPPSEFPLPSFGGKIWIFLELGIHHFHRDHKAPYLPPKFCITIIVDSFREDRNTQEN